MEWIYRGARVNGHQFHRDEIALYLNRTLTPYWRQVIERVEERFDYQTSPELLLRCLRERWRVNHEDIRDICRPIGYEPNHFLLFTPPRRSNFIEILEVDDDGNYNEDYLSKEYNPASHPADVLEPNPEIALENNPQGIHEPNPEAN
ncbi:hypothetical protein Adt_11347 [Abeliophyllum distichum]|uniref:Uncharacterized protein n=1 Tax=Abeliophyllum distichum TaxID=126358 RepID=A0ABD1UPC0_9LAMI